MNHKAPVIILAAGRGSRFGAQADTLHKGLLPIHGRPVLNHILEKFAGHRCIFAIGHLKDQLKEYLEILGPEQSCEFITVDNYSGPGSGPGTSLLACREAVTGPFYTISCDTLVTDPIPSIDTNWIGVAPVDNPARFCTAALDPRGNVLDLSDKSATTKNHLAYIGLAGIRSAEKFWEALERRTTLIQNERQVSNGLTALIPGLVGKRFHWLDTGTPEALAAARRQLGETGADWSKTSEQTYVVPPTVIKWSASEKSVKQKVARAHLLQGRVPKVLKLGRHFFAYDYSRGKTLYQAENHFSFDALMNWLTDQLWTTPLPKSFNETQFRKSCDEFYRQKTSDRLKCLGTRKLGGIAGDRWAKAIKRAQIEWQGFPWTQFVDKAIPCVFHGDLNFGNMIRTHDGFSLIDWREEFAGLAYGDLYYDLGKLYAGLCVNFELIRNRGCPRLSIDRDGVPSAETHDSDFLVACRQKFESHCLKRNWDLDHVKLVAASTFFNMAPLHVPPLDAYFLAVGLEKLATWRMALLEPAEFSNKTVTL
ncbi:MAG: NTP transferase domain-containing protein [Deltaproteobacteria bacterium]|nr:NTP transferase domain-containing protein [Deltaproteobacteria bacterium]